MREFVLFSRLGRTAPDFRSLHDAGRLDIVVECIVAGLFLSHGIRKDVIFHGLLNGPPAPPLHLSADGSSLHDVRTDQGTWEHILKKVLSGKSHPGVSVDRVSFEALLKSKADEVPIYVLEERGTPIVEVELGENSDFVFGDHVGLPKKVEGFALRYGEKV